MINTALAQDKITSTIKTNHHRITQIKRIPFCIAKIKNPCLTADRLHELQLVPIQIGRKFVALRQIKSVQSVKSDDK